MGSVSHHVKRAIALREQLARHYDKVPLPHHISNGLYLTKLLDSISLPFLLVEERKTIERIPAAFKHCQAMNRPEVVIFSEAVLLGEA